MPSSSPCHDPIITLEHISFAYGQQPVLRDFTFSIYQRDFVGLIGANGSGKTTLLKMIVGLLKPDHGDIRLFGQPIRQFREWSKIGYVPQRNQLNPLFPATVREVVLSGLYNRRKMFKLVTKADHARADDALNALGIQDLGHRLIGKLSGGQQQRAFLARALINNPKLLILDEPTVGVDAETQEGFFQMIKHMHQKHDITFLLVSHDRDMMKAYLGDEPAYKHGRIGFHVRHSHGLEDCSHEDLTHGLRDYHRQLAETGI